MGDNSKGSSSGYGVSLPDLRKALDNHLYPAIAHFEGVSSNFNRLQNYDPFQIVGPDLGSLSQEFAGKWRDLIGPLVDNRNRFIDTVKQFAQALEDVARTYGETERTNAHGFHSIMNN